MNDFKNMAAAVEQINKKILDDIQALFKAENYDQAIALINSYLAAEQHYQNIVPELYYWLGWSHYKKGEKDIAFNLFKTYIRLPLRIQLIAINEQAEAIKSLLQNVFNSSIMVNNSIDKGNFALTVLTDVENFREILLSNSNLFLLLVSTLTSDHTQSFWTSFSQNFSHLLLMLQDYHYLQFKKWLFKSLQLQEPVRQFFLNFKPNPENILNKNMLNIICQKSISTVYDQLSLNFIQIIYAFHQSDYAVITQLMPTSVLSNVIADFIIPVAHLLNKLEAIEFFLPKMKKEALSSFDVYHWVPVWYQNNHSHLIEKYLSVLHISATSAENDSDSDETGKEPSFDLFVRMVPSLIARIDNEQTKCIDFLLKTFDKINEMFFVDFRVSYGTNFSLDEHILIAAIDRQENPDLVSDICQNFCELPIKRGEKPILISVYRDSDGKTALHHAVEKGQLETVRVLLNPKITGDRSTVANCQDRNNDTPMHIACAKKNYGMICLLLTNPGASFLNRNTAGETPLDALLKHGAKLLEKDKHGKNMMEHLLEFESTYGIKIGAEIMQAIQSACNTNLSNQELPNFRVQKPFTARKTPTTSPFWPLSASSSSHSIPIPITTTNTATNITQTSTTTTSSTILTLTHSSTSMDKEDEYPYQHDADMS